MSDIAYPRIDITPVWARFNDDLIRLVDYVPDDKLDWLPAPGLWNTRDVLLHIANARDIWLTRMNDGVEAPAIDADSITKSGVQSAYRRTWARLEAVLNDSDTARLDGMYGGGGNYDKVSGHWIAFHLLEHDIHHRADIFHYLALLGIETPDVGTPSTTEADAQ